jgi:sugar phosphate isomerase/epimerase
MPVFHYLDLSTSHLTEEEVEELEAREQRPWYEKAKPGDPIVRSHPFGMWVHVPVGQEGQDEYEDGDAEARRRRFPNLQRAIELARSLDCDWINFDADADQHEELPTYEW